MDEHAYLETLRDVLENGSVRPDRTGVGTVSLFARQMRFDISSSVPILTTKRMPFKMIIRELLWFLRGETDSKVLERQGVSIWQGNTTREFLDARGLSTYTEGDIGPMYGYQWRHYGCPYEGCDADYTGKGFDQLTRLIDGLKTDPFSRRHMLTTYNPEAVDASVLAPCHGIVAQFYVNQSTASNPKLRLSCHVYNRSQDMFLGVPFNIASYAVMTYIIAKKCDMDPYELIVSTGDTHIYSTHIEQVKEQLKRHPFAFPKLSINENVATKSFKELDVSDFELIGYQHHTALSAPMAV